MHQSWPGVAAAARLPAVHPLAAVGVLALAPDRRLGEVQQVPSPRRTRRWRRRRVRAEALRREIDEVDEIVAHSSCPRPGVHEAAADPTRARPAGRSRARRPRRRRPAYGVSLWRCCRSAGVDRELASGDPTRRGRHRSPARCGPCGRTRPASAAGAALIQPARSRRRDAPLERAGPHGRQRQLERGDAAPRARRSRPGLSSPAAPASDRSRRDRARRIPARATARRDRSRSRIGGAHLNAVAPSGISLARERQVVRAGLGGDRHAAGARGARSRRRPPPSDRWTMCDARA